MKRIFFIITAFLSLIIAVSCIGGSCKKAALAYLEDTISLQWKSPKSFHYDTPEIVRETDSTFLAKVKIYGANSYGTEICNDYMYLYRKQDKPLMGPQQGGIVISLDSDNDQDKSYIESLRNAYKRDEILRKENPESADTFSLLDVTIIYKVGTVLGVEQLLKKHSIPF